MVLSGNTSDTDGGAVAVSSGSLLVGPEVRFESNVALDDGGAVALNGAVLEDVEGTLYLANTGSDGGAIYAVGGNIEFLPDTTDDKLLQRLSKAGVKAETAADLVRLYGSSDPHRIVWHLDEALRQHKAGKLKSPAAWILSGIKEDWRPQKPLFEALARVRDTARSEAEDIQHISAAGFAATLEGLERGSGVGDGLSVRT